MTTPEMTDEDALIMAGQCPLIRGAYASGEAEVIRRTELDHPPSRCDYVKAHHKRLIEAENELHKPKTGAKTK
jgi:hypothetical protein